MPKKPRKKGKGGKGAGEWRVSKDAVEKAREEVRRRAREAKKRQQGNGKR